MRTFGGGTVRAPRGASVVIDAPAGALRGTRAGRLSVFLGVPYAAPPTGANRWAPPKPAPRFASPFDATHAGPVCPQIARGHLDAESIDDAPVEGDEDCLRLNVWTAAAASARRPVMVFIHGGGFLQGSGTSATYDGSMLATGGGVVVVTLNYRLGVLGLLAHEAFARENEAGSAGDYAILDQLAALRWVHDNIAAFGGDPTNVTIFGESAGAVAVCAVVASPLSAGLFSRAISESGGRCGAWPTLREGVPDALSGFARAAEIAAAAGCDGRADVAACLRGLDAATLVRAGMHGERMGLGLPAFGPVIDGTVLQGTLAERLQTGAVDAPMIIGTNTDESTMFFAREPVTDAADYAAHLRRLLGSRADVALQVYPPTLFGTPKETFLRAVTETVFTCPAEALARAAAGGPAPAYLYHFEHHLSGLLGERLGSFHSIELVYLFASFPDVFSPSPEDLRVTQSMQSAWTGFARRGVPNTSPSWPAYREDAPAIFRIDATPSVATDVSEGRCARLRALGPGMGW
jgi:para-nitrobenzyl esterase